MHISKEDWLAQRAYALWEAEGRCAGRDRQHWQQAVEEYARLEATRASAHGEDIVLKFGKPVSKKVSEPVLRRPIEQLNLPKAS